MTPPSFPHAGWCNVHGAYDKPLAKGECTCGADARRAVHNVAVESCAHEVELAGAGAQLSAAERDLFFSVAARLRKLKVPDGE